MKDCPQLRGGLRCLLDYRKSDDRANSNKTPKSSRASSIEALSPSSLDFMKSLNIFRACAITSIIATSSAARCFQFRTVLADIEVLPRVGFMPALSRKLATFWQASSRGMPT